jgi:hypothetical protein
MSRLQRTDDTPAPIANAASVDSRPVRIRLLYHPSCPHKRRVRKRLRRAIRYAEIEPFVVEETAITSFEEAVAGRLHGSPTVLIDDIDPFAAPETTVSLGCRLFQTESGTDDAPSIPQLITALQSARRG